MFAARLILLAVILPVSSLGSGLWLVGPLRWPGPQRLCAAVGLSLLLLYLGGTALYLLNLSPQIAWLFTAVNAGLLAAARKDVLALWRHRPSRRLMLAFALVLAWALLLIASVRLFSGGFWMADCLEHYQRSLFFIDRPDPHVSFLGIYALPARPPMMNIIAAQFMAQTGQGFDFFLFIFTFLNSFVFLAAAVMLPYMARRGRRGLPVLACLFLLNPAFAQNATFSWTKFFCVFYVLLGLALYLEGWRKNDARRTAAAFAALAAACLVHYSAGPYVLFLACHYLLVILPSRRSLRELAAVVLTGGLLLATWLGWSIALLGVRTTFRSNSTVTDSSRLTFAGNILKVAVNLYHTLVPFPLRPTPFGYRDALTQPNAAAALRDYFFCVYQVNLLPAMGIAGGVLVVYCLATARAPQNARPPRWFWPAFVLACLILGVATCGAVEDYGVAHVMLLPLVILGLALLASRFTRLPRPLRIAAVLGAAVDLVFGILLQFSLETRNPAIYSLGQDRRGRPMLIDNLGLSRAASSNIAAKAVEHLTYLGDHLDGYVALSLAAAMAVSLGALIYLAVLAAPPTRRASMNGPADAPPTRAGRPADE